MQNDMVEKVLDILIDARNRNLTMGSILHSDCRYFAETLVKNDVVNVVRCKDCKYYSGHETCNVYLQFSTKVEPDHYCGYGERKDDDGKIY